MSTKARTRALIAFAAILATSALLVGLLRASAPRLSVSFHGEVNDPENGRVGLIEVINHLNEPMDLMGAWYVPAGRTDLSMNTRTPIASIYPDGPTVQARTTNYVRVSLPTNSGSYKLVFQCVPERMRPSRIQNSLRYKVVWPLDRHLHFSQATLIRWFNGF